MSSGVDLSDGHLRDLYQYDQILGRHPHLGDSVPDESLLVVAEALACVGRTQEAFDFLAGEVIPRLRRVDVSDCHEALCLFGRLGIQLGETASAKEAFRKARRQNPEDWEPHFFPGGDCVCEGEVVDCLSALPDGV